MQGKKLIYIILLFAVIISSCKIKYSFTGASISPDDKTLSIQDFPNNAPLINPSLSQTFVESLKDKFLSQTSLQLVESDGDLDFSGEITGYSTKPMAIQGNETAALNRLTITIKVKYAHAKDDKQNFETSFSRYADYESSNSLDAVEAELVKQILEQINEDIFNKSVANW